MSSSLADGDGLGSEFAPKFAPFFGMVSQCFTTTVNTANRQQAGIAFAVRHEPPIALTEPPLTQLPR